MNSGNEKKTLPPNSLNPNSPIEREREREREHLAPNPTNYK